ncbi:MAG TPA: protoporphyrinogen oxidase, partial [Acidimicrobiales bacterium]
MTRHVVVVGGGITGLTAAFTLLDQQPDLRVTLVEAQGRLGGKVATGPFAGHPVDAAADAFLARVLDGIELCERLGLRDRLVSPAARTAYLYSRGALRRFPEGLVLGIPTDLDALSRSGVISPEGVARAALDLTMGRDPEVPGGPRDETVGALVRRRLGDEIYDVLVGPLLSGVNAGDADWLSVAAGAPQFATGLCQHGSLIAAARAQRAAAEAADPSAPVFFGLPTGTQTLIDALADRIVSAGGRIHIGVRVTDLAASPDGGYRVTVTDGGVGSPAALQAADAVILATPTFVTGPLVAPFGAAVAAEMGELEYASAIMVVLAVPKAGIDHPL